MKPMHLLYYKISPTIYKMFYQDGLAYDEFFIEITPETEARGEAEIYAKDPSCADDLLDGLAQALVQYKN